MTRCVGNHIGPKGASSIVLLATRVPLMSGKGLNCALAGIVAGLLIAILIASEIDPAGSQPVVKETRPTALQFIDVPLSPSAQSPSTALRIDEAFNELAASWPVARLEAEK